MKLPLITAVVSLLSLASGLAAADVVQGPTSLPISNIEVDASGNQKFTPKSELVLNPPPGFGEPPSLTFLITNGKALVKFKPKSLEFKGGVPVLLCESGHEFSVGFISNALYCFAVVKDSDLEELTKASKEVLLKRCEEEKSLDAFYRWLQKDVTEAVDERVAKPEAADEKKRTLEAFARLMIHPHLQKALNVSH
ncbi:hypothetical protein [Prosthecobacter sp.]|uniref:hypothetical protein n=1 Tax=Prosthecobacter sp. TaxID=1965333 RepID=UPI003784669A